MYLIKVVFFSFSKENVFYHFSCHEKSNTLFLNNPICVYSYIVYQLIQTQPINSDPNPILQQQYNLQSKIITYLQKNQIPHWKNMANSEITIASDLGFNVEQMFQALYTQMQQKAQTLTKFLQCSIQLSGANVLIDCRRALLGWFTANSEIRDEEYFKGSFNNISFDQLDKQADAQSLFLNFPFLDGLWHFRIESTLKKTIQENLVKRLKHCTEQGFIHMLCYLKYILDGNFDSGQYNFNVYQIPCSNLQPYQVFFQCDLAIGGSLIFCVEIEKLPVLNQAQQVLIKIQQIIGYNFQHCIRFLDITKTNDQIRIQELIKNYQSEVSNDPAKSDFGQLEIQQNVEYAGYERKRVLKPLFTGNLGVNILGKEQPTQCDFGLYRKNGIKSEKDEFIRWVPNAFQPRYLSKQEMLSMKYNTNIQRWESSFYQEHSMGDKTDSYIKSDHTQSRLSADIMLHPFLEAEEDEGQSQKTRKESSYERDLSLGDKILTDSYLRSDHTYSRLSADILMQPFLEGEEELGVCNLYIPKLSDNSSIQNQNRSLNVASIPLSRMGRTNLDTLETSEQPYHSNIERSIQTEIQKSSSWMQPSINTVPYQGQESNKRVQQPQPQNKQIKLNQGALSSRPIQRKIPIIELDAKGIPKQNKQKHAVQQTILTQNSQTTLRNASNEIENSISVRIMSHCFRYEDFSSDKILNNHLIKTTNNKIRNEKTHLTMQTGEYGIQQIPNKTNENRLLEQTIQRDLIEPQKVYLQSAAHSDLKTRSQEEIPKQLLWTENQFNAKTQTQVVQQISLKKFQYIETSNEQLLIYYVLKSSNNKLTFQNKPIKTQMQRFVKTINSQQNSFSSSNSMQSNELVTRVDREQTNQNRPSKNKHR